MLFALGLYNYARFGSFFDFGTDYMLTRRLFDPLPSFYLPNLHSYVFRPYRLSCEFPFLRTPFFAWAETPAWVARESGWEPKEPLVGFLVGTPALLFALIALATAALVLARRRRSTDVPAGDRLYVWLVASCAAIWLLAGLPALGVYFPTMRYLSDVTSGALILTFLGFWTLIAYLRRRGARIATGAVWTLGAVLLLYSVTVGVLLGFQGGYYRSFKAHNRPLYEKMIATYSVCERTPAAAPAVKRR